MSWADRPEGSHPRRALQADVAAFTLRALQGGDVAEIGADAVAAVRSALPGTDAALVPAAAGGTPQDAPGRTATPVLVEGSTWAYLLVTWRSDRPVHPEEVRFLTMIALVLAAAVERDRTARRHAVIDDLEAFSERVGDRAALVAAAAVACATVTRSPSCLVVRVVPGTRTAVVVAGSRARDTDVGRQYLLDPVLAQDLAGERTLVEHEREAGAPPQAWPLPPGRPSGAYLATPVVVCGIPWGRLVAHSPEPRPYTDAERAAARSVAALLAAALERAAARDRQAALETEVALLDGDGVITWVNEAWERFSRENGGDPARTGVGVSYLACCDAADDVTARDVAAAIRAALRGELPAPVGICVPCHSADSRRWYDVLVSSRYDDAGRPGGASVTLSPADP